jgi:hypothetical protein
MLGLAAAQDQADGAPLVTEELVDKHDVGLPASTVQDSEPATVELAEEWHRDLPGALGWLLFALLATAAGGFLQWAVPHFFGRH